MNTDDDAPTNSRQKFLLERSLKRLTDEQRERLARAHRRHLRACAVAGDRGGAELGRRGGDGHLEGEIMRRKSSMAEIKAIVDVEGLEAEYARRVGAEGYESAVKSMETEAAKYITFQKPDADGQEVANG